MRSLRYHGLAFVFAAGLVGGCTCASDNPEVGDGCDGPNPVEGCGKLCSADNPCPQGTYCNAAGTCIADCGPGPENPCPGVQYCDPTGRCISAEVDAPMFCANINLEATPVTPTVILIIDQSGSMTADFGGAGSRWDVLRDSLLLDPGGLIADLQGSVEFGLAMYSAASDGPDGVGGAPIGECPQITSVAPALNNYASIQSVYAPAVPIEDTPTGDAIDQILDDYLNSPDPDPDPVIFIVGTDGEPDRCEELDPQNGQAEAIAAVERAFGEGIQTYMISVGRDVSQAHMQDMANAGLGRGAADPDAQFWVAGDDQELRDALNEIVGGVLSCDVMLNGSIDVASACTGEVLLNGRPLVCNDPDGWEPVDATHIRLLGQACDDLTSENGSTLSATFPCEVIVF